MTVGRKRKPTELKRRSGTLQPCRTNDNEPDYVLASEIPDPPKYLSKIGRDVYYSTASELLQLGILTRISLTIFVAYCIEVARYYDAQEKLSKEGDRIKNRFDEWIINPLIKVANDALTSMTRLACEFGITPASSSKVKAIPRSKNTKSELVSRISKHNA
jgi:P27 family predicted phage terminase small subunit